MDAKGKVQDALRKALKDGTFTLPEPFAAQLPQVKEVLRKLAGQAGNQERRRAQSRSRPGRRFCTARSSRRSGTASSTRRPTACSSTTRSLIDDLRQGDRRRRRRSPRRACNGAKPISRSARPAWRRRRRRSPPRSCIEEADIELPDLLTDLQDKTQLTRRSLVAHLDRKRAARRLQAEPASSSSSWPPNRSTAPSGWRWWTASSTSASATRTTTPRSSSSRRS